MKALSLILFSFLLSLTLFAQEDAEGCKDHPMFNRMPNFYIIECSKNYGLADLAMSNGESKSIEGYKTYIRYEFNTESGQETPSFFQVFKNYENALKKYGVKRIYLASQYGTLFFKTEGKSVWIGIEAPGETAGWCSLTIMEIEEMKQEIKASEMLDALNKDGHIALYINFETGKSGIKPESQSIIDQIAEMLSANAELKVSIEGHTDNVGSAASNQTLSESRANAVLAAIVMKGIEKTRLSAKGWGQTKPIADNSTDDGKAQNRRVEIVKK
jgi:OmpA-OmpF porin, OOP family